MDGTERQISDLLQEVSETHHPGFPDRGWGDDDWASWYADWLINLSELPTLLGAKPVRSELVYLLVALDKDYTSGKQDQSWPAFYTPKVLSHFRPAP